MTVIAKITKKLTNFNGFGRVRTSRELAGVRFEKSEPETLNIDGCGYDIYAELGL